MVTTKQCRKCKATKVPSDFTVNKRYADGLSSYCKQCASKVARDSKKNNPPDPLYSVWAGIKQRCNNPNNKLYKNYGARGIKVDSTWADSFNTFKQYIDALNRPANSRLTLIDPNGDYAPGNVEWSISTNNTIPITYKGKTQSASAWANELGMPASTVINRVNRGWSTDRALSTPVNDYSK